MASLMDRGRLVSCIISQSEDASGKIMICLLQLGYVPLPPHVCRLVNSSNKAIKAEGVVTQ